MPAFAGMTEFRTFYEFVNVGRSFFLRAYGSHPRTLASKGKGGVKDFSFAVIPKLFQVVIQDGGPDESVFHQRIRQDQALVDRKNLIR